MHWENYIGWAICQANYIVHDNNVVVFVTLLKETTSLQCGVHTVFENEKFFASKVVLSKTIIKEDVDSFQEKADDVNEESH